MKTKTKMGRMKRTALLMSALLLFAGVVTGVFVFLNGDPDVADAYDGSGTVTLKADTSTVPSGGSNISEIGRSGENWWKFYVTGQSNQTIFCLNSGAYMNNNDTVQYTIYNASSFGNYVTGGANLAKAMTWFNYELSNQTYSTLSKNQTQYAVQAYCWAACKSGANLTTAVFQALRNTGLSSSSASTFASNIVSAISNTSARGKIYYYTVSNCAKGFDESKHQHLIGWVYEYEVETAYATETLSVSTTLPVTITIQKKDSATSKLIDTATFKIELDGTNVSNYSVSTSTGSYSSGVFTTKGGKVVATITLTLTGSDVKSAKYWYVKNWNDLTAAEKTEYSQKGYYDSYSKAYAKAVEDAQQKQADAIASLKSASRTWKITELTAPLGHSLSSPSYQTKTTGNASFTVTFNNTAKNVKVKVTKVLDSNYTQAQVGVKATMKGAVYGIYANETIYDTDNSTVLYSSGDLIKKLTIGSDSTATSSAILPYGYKYYVQEITASKGYVLDTTKYYFTATDSTTELTVEETPIVGNLVIYKAYEDEDSNLYPEKEAVFELYNENNKLVATISADAAANDPNLVVYEETVNENGKNINYYVYYYSGLPYGTYTLKQTAGTEDTVKITDQTVSVSKNAEVVELHFTNHYDSPSVQITKTKTYITADGSSTISSYEEGAIFYVIKATYENGTYKVPAFTVSNNTVSLASGTVAATELNSLTSTQRTQYVNLLLSAASKDSDYFAVFKDSAIVLTTDAYGSAFSYVDEQDGTTYYVVLQTYGEDGYELSAIDTFSFTKATDAEKAQAGYEPPKYSQSFTDHERQAFFSIQKYMVDADEVSNYGEEENAEFTILDESKVTLDAIKAAFSEEDYKELVEAAGEETVKALLNAMDEDERQAFVNSLDTEAILTTITTDAGGMADCYIRYENRDKFVVLQTSGTKGYALMPALWASDAMTEDEINSLSASMTAKEWSSFQKAGYIVKAVGSTTYLTDYSIEYTDIYDNYGFISILKYAEIGNLEFAVEPGATFVIKDADGNTVATLETDENGYATTLQTEIDSEGEEVVTAGWIPYGTYTVEQTYSPDNHELMQTTTVYVTKRNYHSTLALVYDNSAAEVELNVTKYSDDTYAKDTVDPWTPVEGATYTIYAAENIYEGTTVAVSSYDSVTDSNGNTVYYSSEELILAENAAAGSIRTDENGTGALMLHYGTYYMMETASQLDFIQSDEKTYFTLFETVDADGNYVPAITIYDTSDINKVVITMDMLAGCPSETILLTEETDADLTFYATSLTTYDTPVYGSISVEKTASEAGAADDASIYNYSFQTGMLAGCTFELYAKEDIVDDAGNVVWAAGTKISEATTEIVAVLDEDGEEVLDSDGNVTYHAYAEFLWDRDGDGTPECADFYLGSYYVVEVSAPYGYEVDSTPKEVVLTYDHSAELMNDIGEDADASDTGSDIGNSDGGESEGTYILTTGEKLNPYLTSANTIIFTWKTPGTGVTTYDVSSVGDNSVRLWEDGDTIYISSCKTNQVIYFNEDSSHMFEDCTLLQNIAFNNVDTSDTKNMSYMFKGCISLETLDLSMFNTAKVTNVTSMFEGCGATETIYVNSSTVQIDYENATLTSLVATAKTIFTCDYEDLDGTIAEADTFTVSDFLYTGWYTAEYFNTPFPGTVTLTEDDIDYFEPAQALQQYADEWFKMDEDEEEAAYFYMVVTIHLASTSEYYEITGGTMQVTVTVCDPTKITTQTLYDEHPTVTVEGSDALITMELGVAKVEEGTSTAVEGAKYTLYANCEIGYTDADGNFVVIYEPGDEIATGTTVSGDASVTVFSGLLTDKYAVAGTYETPKIADGKTGTLYYVDMNGEVTKLTNSTNKNSDFMYYITETAPGQGYELVESRWYFSGDLSFLDKQGTTSQNYEYTLNDGSKFTLSWTQKSTTETTVTATITAEDPLSDYLTLAKEWDDDDEDSADNEAPEDRPDYVIFHMAGTTGRSKTAFDYIFKLTEETLTVYAYSDSLWEANDPNAALDTATPIAVYAAWTGRCSLDGNDCWYANLDDEPLSGTAISLNKKTTTVTTFEENVTALQNENVNYNPDSIGNTHRSNEYIYVAINSNTLNIRVTKSWEDQNNRDDYRATTITVNLYKDGTRYATATLSGANDWTYTWYDLPGVVDDYTVGFVAGEEPSASNEIGTYYGQEWNAEEYDYELSTTDLTLTYDEETQTYVYALSMINIYGDTPQLTAKKTILLEDLEKWLKNSNRDFVIAFTLSGETEEGAAYTRTETISYSYANLAAYKKAAVTGSDGQKYVTYSVTFGDELLGTETDEKDILPYGTYTLTETVYKADGVTKDSHWELIKVTTAAPTGYSKVLTEDGEYTGAYFKVSSDKSYKTTYSATFTNELHANPKLVVTKKVKAEEMDWVDDDASFTFTLYGTTEDNVTYTENNTPYVKTVTFKKSEVETLIAEAKTAAAAAGEAWDGYIYLSVVFGDTDNYPEDPELEFGTYTLKETGSEIYWMLDYIDWDDPLQASFDASTVDLTREVEIKFSSEDDFDVEYYYCYYYNTPRLGDVEVTKYDYDGTTPLAGVTFELEDESGAVLTNVLGETLRATTDETGTVHFWNLKAGTYYLAETATTDGRTLLAERVKIVIPLAMTDAEVEAYEKAGTPVDTTEGDTTVHYDGSYYFYHLEFSVTNNIELEMPSAGILNTTNGVPMLPIAICIASACSIGAWVLIRRRRTARLLRA